MIRILFSKTYPPCFKNQTAKMTNQQAPKFLEFISYSQTVNKAISWNVSKMLGIFFEGG